MIIKFYYDGFKDNIFINFFPNYMIYFVNSNLGVIHDNDFLRPGEAKIKTIRDIGKTKRKINLNDNHPQKSIKIVGQRQKPVDLDIVAEVLGAERTGIKIDTRRSPISLFGLRQFISKSYTNKGNKND